MIVGEIFKVEVLVEEIIYGNWYYEGHYRDSLTRSKTILWPSSPTTGHIPYEDHNSKYTVETVADFIFEDSKVTADGDSSHEIKRHLLLGRKAMTNLDNILKGRGITLPIKVCLVKAMVFQ